MQHAAGVLRSKRISRRQFIAATMGITVVAITPRVQAVSSDYPTQKPIRIVIPFPPGGATDVVGRIISQALSERLGQSIVIDNRPGASGMIGADQVAKATPDGYTLLLNVSGHLVNPALYPNMPHDPIKDFAPITNVAYTPIQLIVGANSPVRSVDELIKLIRAEPGRHNFASSSTGTPGHLTGELFKLAAKLDVTHIPYKGTSQALTDVISGQVTYMFDSMPSSINLVKAGKLRSLGVTATHRVDVLPDVPTFAELHYPSVDLTTWYGLWGPAHMSPDIVNRVYTELSAVLARDDIKQRLSEVIAQPMCESPERFNQFCVTEAQRYASIVRTAHIRLQ